MSPEEKRERAKQIGVALSNNERWHSHGRGISRETLKSESEIRLRIDNIEDNENLSKSLEEYYALLRDYLDREQFRTFVHTREFF